MLEKPTEDLSVGCVVLTNHGNEMTIPYTLNYMKSAEGPSFVTAKGLLRIIIGRIFFVSLKNIF